MTISRALIFSPHWLGDCVMALPGIQLFSERNPETELVVAARTSVAPLWSHMQEVTEILVLPESKIAQGRLFLSGTAGVFDIVLVLPHSFRAALLARLTGAKVRRGLAINGRGFLYTEAVSPANVTGKHQSFEYASVICGPLTENTHLPAPSLTLPDRVVQEFRGQHGLNGRVLGMLPGAARGPSKQWPVDRYAELAHIMLAENLCDQVVVLGSPKEHELGEYVGQKLRDEQWVNLCGKTRLVEFPVALKSCDRVVCNDSGGMHVSAAVGVPLVALFGTTNPVATGPLGDRSSVIQKSDKKERAVPRDCPEARKALESISVAEVVEALTAL